MPTPNPFPADDPFLSVATDNSSPPFARSTCYLAVALLAAVLVAIMWWSDLR